MQIPEQDRGQGARGNPDWKPGVSANPRGKESKAQRMARRDATVEAWCAPFGGVSELQPAELMLLQQAAELSMVRPRRSEDQVRHANTISRILAQCGLANKHQREPIVEEAPPSASKFNALNWLRERERSAP